MKTKDKEWTLPDAIAQSMIRKQSTKIAGLFLFGLLLVIIVIAILLSITPTP